MKILPISNSQNRNINDHKNNEKNFTGLTKFLAEEIYAMPYKEAQRMIDSCDKNSLVVGHFPKDLLALIMKKTNNPREVKANIQLFNETMSEQANKVVNSEKALLDVAQHRNIEEFCFDSIIKWAKSTYQNSISYVNSLSKFRYSNEYMTRLLNNDDVNNTMKQIGIIPKNGETKYEYIDEGGYKKCFRLSFLDGNKQPVAHNKSFLVFKYPNLDYKGNSIVHQRLDEYIKNTDYDTFYQHMFEKINADDSLTDEAKEKSIALIEPFYSGKYKTADFNPSGMILEEFYDTNGVFPEANAALKIRKDLGENIIHSNIITPYTFDLKNNYALCEFADADMAYPKLYYDFAKHHLIWSDSKLANNVHGRLIDFGCITPDTKPYYY